MNYFAIDFTNFQSNESEFLIILHCVTLTTIRTYRPIVKQDTISTQGLITRIVTTHQSFKSLFFGRNKFIAYLQKMQNWSLFVETFHVKSIRLVSLFYNIYYQTSENFFLIWVWRKFDAHCSSQRGNQKLTMWKNWNFTYLYTN